MVLVGMPVVCSTGLLGRTVVEGWLLVEMVVLCSSGVLGKTVVGGMMSGRMSVLCSTEPKIAEKSIPSTYNINVMHNCYFEDMLFIF